jgi:ABC-type Fe3+/spermidine/putrescine transport system ATPase subunit
LAQFIRPDDVQIKPYHSEGLEGKITIRTYLGNHYRYYVNVQGYRQPIEITHPEKLEIGTIVRIIIPSDKCRVLQPSYTISF